MANALVGTESNPIETPQLRGARILHWLYVALSCLQDSSVEARDRRGSIQQFAALMGAAPHVDTVLSASGHAITLDGVRVGLESRSFLAVEFILDVLAKRSIGGFVIGREATSAEIEVLLRVVAGGAEPSVAAELIRRGIRRLSVLPVDDGALTLLLDLARRRRSETGDRASGVASDLRSVYVATLLLEHIGEVRVGGPRLAKSIIKCVADSLLLHPELIDLLAVLQGADVDYVRHGAMVSVYSVLIGRRIGLPTQLLIELGVAALFHDVGRLDTAEAYDDDTHAKRGFERFLSIDPSALSLRAMLVARHHHEAVDDDGLSSPGLEHADLFSAIVHVADIFERGGGVASDVEDGVRAGLARVREAVERRVVPELLAEALEAVHELAS